jgi:hypothetical protein
MRLGSCLAVAVLSISSTNVGRADELMRICGARGVGFIRTSHRQVCFYSPVQQAQSPAQGPVQGSSPAQSSAPQTPVSPVKSTANASP